MDPSFSLQGQPLNTPTSHPQDETITTKKSYTCEICNNSTNKSKFVTCNICKLAFHISCTNIDANILPHTWTCKNCSLQHHKPPCSTNFDRNSMSGSSDTSRSRNIALELQRLHEEANLEREIIRKKYQILEDAAVNETEANEESPSVQEWLDNQPDTAEQTNIANEQTKAGTSYQNAISSTMNSGCHITCPPNTTTATLPMATALSSMPVSTNNHFTTLTQPNLVNTTLNNNTTSNFPTFINHAPQQFSHFPSRNVSNMFSYTNNTATVTDIRHSQPFHIPRTGVSFIEQLPPPTIIERNYTTTNQDPPPNIIYHDQPFISQPVTTAPITTNNICLTQQQLNARQTVPKDLPTFTGMPEEWPLFSSTYDWSTKICGLTDAENLIRLQKALRGDALRSVQHILIHPSCVPAAISTLKLLFGQPEKICNSLKKRIKLMPSININNLNTITAFAVEVKGLETSIKACGLTDELNNSSLLQELIVKLPSQFQLNWGSTKTALIKNNKKANLTEFSNWIYDVGLSASSINVENNNNKITTTEVKNKTRNAYVNAHRECIKRDCLVCYGDCCSVAKCKKFLAFNRNEKWNLIRKYNLCKVCLSRHYGACKSNIVCTYKDCKIKHNSLLHKKDDKNKEIMLTDDLNANKGVSITTHATHNNDNSDSILFKILPIVIYGANNKSIKTYAFIDEGSSVSLINENIINDLQLSGSPEPLCLKWTGNMGRNEENSKRVSLKISGPNRTKHNIEVRTVKHLSLPIQSINYKSVCRRFPYLNGLPVVDYANAVPTLLLGINNLKLCIPTRIKEGKTNEPMAIRTRLGWLICGSSAVKPTNEFEYNFYMCECDRSNDNDLNNLVKKFYSIEMAGLNCITPLVGKDDQRAINYLEKYTKQLENGHYETSLLWRYDNIQLPKSFGMAMKRLQCLEKSIDRNINLKNIFEKTIDEYLEKGYITKIFKSESDANSSQNIWYLPIFAVFNKNKPKKTRIVWDAAAKSEGISLNCMLLKGPDMLASLPSILFRFRERKVAVCGDIEQMFHQIYIRKEDQNAQRFLWRNCDRSKEPDIYVMNVLIFGASCSPCISQYVKNLNAIKHENNYPAAADAIKNNHYVDDFLTSTDTPEEASKLAQDVKYVHSQAGFNIRNWCSNNNAVLKDLNVIKIQDNMCLNISDGLETEKVLGVFWVPATDKITFKISPTVLNNEIFLEKKKPSKREVLKILMSIYDPLGLIGNFLMFLKVVLQEIWRSGVDWDEPILEPQITKWKYWVSLLPNLEKVSMPRCYLHHFQNYKNLDVQLHMFVDASEMGYAAVAYLRIYDGKNADVSLVGSKTRVAPLKVASIPRLELMAALIGARFANNILQSHSIKIIKKRFWSDSQTVLSWIRSDHRKYHQFVAIRVSEILEVSEMDEWLWIAGKNNVADEATKWIKKPDLSDASRWLNGPTFLKLSEEDWPVKTLNPIQTVIEIKQHSLTIHHIKPFVNIERFSRWCRAVRAVAYVVKFCNIIKNKRVPQKETELTQEELIQAEITLLKQTQHQFFYNEIDRIEKAKNLPKTSVLYKLTPIIRKDSLLCVGGRIDNACVSDEQKNPVILPKNSYTTKLLILHYHNLYHHINHETLINEIRQKYYIPKLRTVCKIYIKQCQMCKIRKIVPRSPQMARLPRARLATFQAPFTFTGLDFFGPLFVVVNRHKEKRYGALFTCLTVRAVHIEIVHTLNTSSCIMAIRNFIARRGQPREFFSDNGTNFVGAERDLREAVKQIDKNELVRNFTSSSSKWNFNPPSAPHMGGAWERLVRSVKTVLYEIKQERYPNDETLKSMLAEVENIINSRPLTYVPVESENEEAITPNHLLLGSSNGIKPLAIYNDDGVVLKECWLRCQEYANKFWKRWVAEYLPTLTCRTKWYEKASPLTVGQLVVVVDPANPRNVWPRGKIIEVTKSEDGQVRKAKVMTTSGILVRPATKLAVLDVAQDME